MLKSVFYVSAKAAPWPHDGPDVEAITRVARARNAALDLTGALISSDEHFAQVLEGPAAAVDAVMASIFRDPRHWRVTVLEEAARGERRFPQWSLAYAGHTPLVALRIAPRLLTPRAQPQDTAELMKLIQAVARPL
ncbi:MAG TPA: BLUF domain-containing protein [Phenylobacterium sp.]|jgi:hypothetical protein|uniref:BLUF domain-containing protein n=1 Tax=Phenylobacterium sp. TaxID=1871053 RepID=UPI002C6911DA|nr:BLUF domain-containing protein [Phenylobacterium sp.]HXA38864.1 BLUF domain-containing protein [Phenylobacterium sp.]